MAQRGVIDAPLPTDSCSVLATFNQENGEFELFVNPSSNPIIPQQAYDMLLKIATNSYMLSLIPQDTHILRKMVVIQELITLSMEVGRNTPYELSLTLPWRGGQRPRHHV